MNKSKTDKMIPYKEGQLVRVSRNGKIIETRAHIYTANNQEYKNQKKCPICGKLGREWKSFNKVSKKGYYDVFFQHRVASITFKDIDTGKTIKRLQLRDYCKIGKGYTMDMLLNAMSKEKSP